MATKKEKRKMTVMVKTSFLILNPTGEGEERKEAEVEPELDGKYSDAFRDLSQSLLTSS